MNIHDIPKMFNSAPWTTVAIGSIPLFGVFGLLLSFDIARYGTRVVTIVAVMCGVIAILAVMFVGSTVNVGIGEEKFVAVATYDYGVNVMQSDAVVVIVASDDGKESHNFNVDGYISSVYSQVSKDGDITLRDAHTNHELPRK